MDQTFVIREETGVRVPSHFLEQHGLEGKNGAFGRHALQQGGRHAARGEVHEGQAVLLGHRARQAGLVQVPQLDQGFADADPPVALVSPALAQLVLAHEARCAQHVSQGRRHADIPARGPSGPNSPL